MIWVPCPACEGTGADIEDSSKNCYMCEGSGIVEAEEVEPFNYTGDVEKDFEELFVEKKKKE